MASRRRAAEPRAAAAGGEPAARCERSEPAACTAANLQRRRSARFYPLGQRDPRVSSCHANRDDRPRPNGRKHGAASDPRGTRRGRVPPRRQPGTHVRFERRGDAGVHVRGAGGRAQAAARGVDHGAGGSRRLGDRRARAAPRRRATSSSTAATRASPTTRGGPKRSAPKGLEYVDVGTSGGVWGLERGYCLMIGGTTRSRRRISIRSFARWRPDTRPRRGPRAAPATCRRRKRATCTAAARRRPLREDGPQRDRIRHHGRLRRRLQRLQPVAETTSSICAEIAELWRRGSVVGSWLLDLTGAALLEDPEREEVCRQGRRLGRGALDAAFRHRRSRARAGARRRAVLALRVTRRGRIRQPPAVRDARAVRRARRAEVGRARFARAEGRLAVARRSGGASRRNGRSLRSTGVLRAPSPSEERPFRARSAAVPTSAASGPSRAEGAAYSGRHFRPSRASSWSAAYGPWLPAL